MPIETPPVTPVAPQTPAAPAPPETRQSKLDAILKLKPLPPEQQQALKDLFTAGDTNNAKIRGALDPLTLDNDAKNQIWKAYYSVDHPVPVGPKPAAPVLPAPPKPPAMLQEHQPYMQHLKPAPLPPPPGPAAQAPQSFDTPLIPAEEQQFQQWKAKFAPKDSGQDYDLRGAFKAGVTPDPVTGHWPDTFKKPNHPTFSNESQYAAFAPDKVGTWNGQTYVPPAAAPKPQVPPVPQPFSVKPPGRLMEDATIVPSIAGEAPKNAPPLDVAGLHESPKGFSLVMSDGSETMLPIDQVKFFKDKPKLSNVDIYKLKNPGLAVNAPTPDIKGVDAEKSALDQKTEALAQSKANIDLLIAKVRSNPWSPEKTVDPATRTTLDSLIQDHNKAVDEYSKAADVFNAKVGQTNQAARIAPIPLAGEQPFKPFPKVPLPPQGDVVGVWDTIKGLPAALKQVRDENLKKTTWEAFRDTLGTTITGMGGLLGAASMGLYEPEKGTVSLPRRLLNELVFQPKLVKTDQGYERATTPPDPTIQIHRPLSQVLHEDWGLPADLAQNGTGPAIGRFVGAIVPWSRISSGVAAAAGITELSEVSAIARLGADGSIEVPNAKKAYDIAREMLRNAGIQAVTGEVYAHLEKAPENETPAETEIRAGQTALYGAGFSVLFDGIAHILQAIPRGRGETLSETTLRDIDSFMNEAYDLFYRSGSFSSEEQAHRAAEKAFMSQMKKGGKTPDEIIDQFKRRFEANAAAKASTEVPTVPGPEEPGGAAPAVAPPDTPPPGNGAAPEIPKVPEPTTNAPVPASAEGVEKPETPPKSVVPEEVGIKAPKKQFTHDGQYVVGTSEGKIVLADGSLVERSPQYMETLGKFGYPEVTPEQIATLAGLAAANKKLPEVPPDEGAAGAAAAVNEPPDNNTPPGTPGAVEQPKIPSNRRTDTGYVPKFTDAEIQAEQAKNGTERRGGPQGEFSPLPRVPEDPSFYDAANKATEDRLIDKIPEPVKPPATKMLDLEKQLETAQGIAADTSQPHDIRSEADLQAADLLDEINVLQKESGVPEGERSQSPNLPAVPEPEGVTPKGTQNIPRAEAAKTPGQKWAEDFNENWYKSALGGPVAQYKPPQSVVPSFEEVRDIYSKMMDLYPNHRQSVPDMLYDLIERRMKKQPYPIELQGATKALGMPQPEDGEKLPPVPKTEARPEEETKVPAPVQSPRQETIERYRGLTNTVATILSNGESIDNPTLTKLANQAFGGERGAGKYDPRDAYDAVEAAINIVISKPGFIDFNDVPGTLKRIEKLESQIPRQADRTQEQVDFQQFSTPPAETFAAVLGAGIKPGMTVLEPSAGTGNIATMMKLAGAEVITNELAPRRQAILEMLNFPVHSVDAQYLDSLLPFSIVPDVVVMNPPFSSTGGRTKGHKTIYGAQHVEQALQRLKPGGRVVAIVGRGMAYGRPAFNDWWEKIEGKYTVRANIGISGKHYGKFGTGFDNQIIVIDKTGPMSGSRIDRIKSVLTGEDLSPAQAADILGPLGKEDIAERILKYAKQAGVETTPGNGSRRAPGLPAPPAIDIHGTGGGGELGEGAGGNGTPAGPAAVGAVERPDVPVPAVGGEGAGVRNGEGGQPGTVESGGTANVGSGSGSGEPAGTGGDAGLARGEINESKSESEGSVFSKYVIRKATFAGSKPHPANIVESATMSSVDPPDVSYTPKLPTELVKSGKVSDVQLEAITYAGQKHSIKLSSGKTAGYWIGDGTGVGKGREIAGIFYDNLKQGKKRGIWFSATAQLKVDAKRDMDGIGLPMDLMIQQDSDMDADIPNKDGIVFSTYSLASNKWDAGKPRLQQLAKWAGEGFDGVIVFDECFVWETLILTENGLLPIGEIVDSRLNLRVLSWDKTSGQYEWKRIVRWLPRKLRHDLVRVTHETGSFVCTPDHKVWTEEEGYIKAGSLVDHSLRLLPETNYVRTVAPIHQSEASVLQLDMQDFDESSDPDAVRLVQDSIQYQGAWRQPEKKTQVLLDKMLREVENVGPGIRQKEDGVHTENNAETSMACSLVGGASKVLGAYEEEQSGAHAWSPGTHNREIEGANIPVSRRQWESDGSTTDAGGSIGTEARTYDNSQGCTRSLQVTTDTLQRRSGDRGIEDCNRDRWTQPQNKEVEVPGPTENRDPEFSRVVRVEILESGGLVGLGSRSLENRIVYDIEVADNHNYFAAGVLVSNCHLMKNAVMANQGGVVVNQPGKQEGTNSGAMGLALDEMFPNAKIVYVSATGATVPRNMGYMSRLGLWGPGAPFPSFVDFLGAMADGGVGAMEMLSRDLKATGSYIGRSISYTGVDYGTVEHELNDDEVANYNDLADVWSEVMQAFGNASANAGSPKNAKGAISAYYSSQQRFFLQVQTALQLSDLFQHADNDLKEGRSVVVSIYNTNEGQVAKKVAAAKADGVDLEDLDFTPREILIDLVGKYFPVEQWTTKFDPLTQKDVPVQMKDEAGNPIINRENAAMRDALLDKIADIRVPDNPLDAIVNHFGPKNVAEVTGRKKRLEGGKYVARKIKDVPLKERDAMEVKRFQSGQVRVAVISGKASAGISLHASKGEANQDRRVFYAMQLSWSADKQMQSFGRVHRSDQVQPPIIKMVLTNLKGQQRLVNTVAMRLASLGALTEGSRESKGGGLFSLHDITDEYGIAALGRTYADVNQDRIKGIKAGPQMIQRMGLADKNGNIRDSDLANVERFLNRIMALHVDEQNAVFNHFYGLFEQVVKDAKAAGKFDEGVTKLPAENIIETEAPQLIYTDPNSGARTSLMTFSGEVQSTRMAWDEFQKIEQRAAVDIPRRATGFYRNKRSGRLYGTIESKPKDYGETDFRLYSANSGYSNAVGRDDLVSNFESVADGAAANEWNDQYKKVPEKVSKQFSLINGAIFPIYDKVMGADGLKNPSVVRAELANGKSRIGILVQGNEIESLKQRLGIGTPLGQATPKQVYDLAKNHSIIELDNGWEIKTSRVHSETRIEINPGQRRVNKEEMDKFGVISERIDYTNRYFIPLDDDSGPLVVGNILNVHKAVRDKTAIVSVEDKPSKSKAPEKKADTGTYVVDPTVPESVKPPVKMGRDYKFPDQKPQVLLKPPVVVGDRTYEPTIIKRSDVKGKPMDPLSGWEVAPGLGVAESLDKPGQFEVTHTVSGLRVADAFDLKRAVAIAEKLSEMGDWTRSVEGLTSDKPFAQAVQAEIKRFAAERGSFSLFKVKPPQKIPNSAVETPQKNIQKLFDTQETISSAWETVKDLPARVKRTMVDPFIYNKDIEMWPIFAEMVRRFQENPSDAATQSAQKIEQILHGMDNSEFQVFSKIVYLEDLYESAVALGEDSIPVRPDPTTNRSVIDSIDEEITRLRNYVATPAVLASVDRHHVWMQEIWDDLVRRGKVDGDGGRAKYYPNYIRRFGEGMDNVLGLPYRMKDPKRMYLKERKGHLQIHDSNYVRVMEQYATRVFIDNSIDDFIQAVAETYDLRTGTTKEFDKLTPDGLKQLLSKGMKPGQIFELPDGRQFSVYQFSPGRVMYPARVINDYVIQDAINSGVDELGIDIDKLRQAFRNGQSGVQSPPQLETVDEFGPGDELTRAGLIMGGQHKMYILPREISNKLMRFRDASNPNPVTELARVATKAFKVLALHSNVLSWQGQNVFSNNIMAAVEDINILGRQKEALQLLRGKLTGPQYDTLLSLIHDARVWNSTFLGTGGTIGAAINRPGLRPYRAGVTGAFSKLNPFGDTPLGDFWRAYEGKLRMVEAITKVASFLENHDRVMRGLPVKHVAVSLGGLDPTSVLAVGRVARELNGDYGATNKIARPIQTLLFPFSTWYIRIVPQVIRALRHKIDPKADAGLLLMAGLFIAAYMWNHLHHWETEKKLDWQKEVLHIDTGVFDEKGNPYIWSEQTPFDAALQIGGLHTFSSNLDRVMSGEWTLEQAARKQLGDMLGFQDQAWLPTAPGAMAQQLLNPMIGVLTEMASNRDAMSGAEIVKKSNPNQWGTLSKRMPDNPVGVRLMEEYYGKRLISPYMQALRAEQMNDPDGPLWNWITEGPLSWKKLLGIRTANLDALDLAKWYDDKNWEQSLLETHSKEIIDTYVQYDAGNLTPEELQDRVVTIMQKDGPSITVGPSITAPTPGYDVYRMQQTNSYKLQVDKALLGKATDQKQREAIIDDMKILEYKLRMESYHGTPKAMKQIGPDGLPYVPQPPVPNQAPRTIPLVPIPPEPAPVP